MQFFSKIEIDADESNTTKRVIEAFQHLGYQQLTPETSLEFVRGSIEGSNNIGLPREWLVSASVTVTTSSSQLTQLSLMFKVDVNDDLVTESARSFWRNDTEKAERYILKGIEYSSNTEIAQVSNQNVSRKVVDEKSITPRNFVIAWIVGCASSAKVGQMGPIIKGHFQCLGLAPE